MNKQQQEYIFSQIGYVPSEEQWLIHLDEHRIRLVAGGERGGKSKSAAMDLMPRMFTAELLWLVAQDYNRTTAEYNYIIEALEALKIKFTATKNVDPGEIITEMGTRIVTKSASDPRKLAMEAPDGILACEGSQLDYETYLRLCGRLAEKRGWLLLSGTFESSLGWYVDLFQLGLTPNDQELKSFSLPTWSNRVIFPGGRTDPEILRLESQFSTEWFMERFGGVPCPPKGLVFKEFRTNIHTGTSENFQFDQSEPINLWIDPGYSHAYAILVAQKRDSETAVIVDEIFETGFTTEDLITVCRKKPWWNKVIGGAIDIAGKQHHGMNSPMETWIKKTGIPLRAKKLGILDGIERTKTSLKVNPITNRPGLYINTKCKGLISELGGCPNPITGATAVYTWKMDKSNNVIGDKPDDKHNDACKALAYGLLDMFGFTITPRAKTQIFKAAMH